MAEIFDHGGGVFALARLLGVPPEELLDFSANINPLGPPPRVREAFNESFTRLVHYPDREAAELRNALASFHEVAPSRLIVSNGSTELIYLLPRFIAGRKALIIAPAFSEYGRALGRAGWEIHYLVLSPGSGFALSPDKLAKRLEEGFELVFLCNPANPTGTLLPLNEIAEILSLCRKTGTFLVLDEAFMDFREEESAKALIAGSGGGIVLRSMTKFYAMPGLRLGYAIGPEEMISRCAGMAEPWSVNTPAQAAGCAALADPDYRTRTISTNAEERDHLFAGLAALPGVKPYPSAANYLLSELDNGMTAARLRDALLKRRIVIRDCSNYEGLDDRFFRVAVRSRDDNRRLLVALEKIL
ncbi:MAG: threonine-phosphate decarboxylase CobD [Geobacteraceae bacterium]|nr:threonine-phosphate decarboxylase CobD [Geobacteraceae bacterium]